MTDQERASLKDSLNVLASGAPPDAGPPELPPIPPIPPEPEAYPDPEPVPIKEWPWFGNVRIAPEAVEFINDAIVIVGQLVSATALDFSQDTTYAANRFSEAVDVLAIALAKAKRGIAQGSPYEDIPLYDNDAAHGAK